MAVKVNGGPYYVAPGSSLGLSYFWAAIPSEGANMGGRYAYALPAASGGTGAWVVTVEQKVYTHNHGPREPRGWEYGVTIRNDGPVGAWVDVYVAALEGL